MDLLLEVVDGLIKKRVFEAREDTRRMLRNARRNTSN